MKQKKTIYRLLLLCPLLLGAVGFTAVDRMSPLDALFNCVQMYVLNYGETPRNVWVELARWTAPLATAGSILLLISSVKQYAVAWLKKVFTDSVAVYGPAEDAGRILAQLGGRGVRGEEKVLPARNYILLGSQEENAAFYAANRRTLEKAQVYMRCDSLPGQSVSPVNVHLFQPMEIAARLFWKTDRLLGPAEEKDGRLSIVFIGFGALGEQLLWWGLQNNIFSPRQRISYHVFGDASDSISAHPMLPEIGDPVLTYGDSWQNHLDVLAGADLILVPERDGEIPLETTVCRLLSLAPGKEITVFVSAPALLTMLDEQERLRLICVSDEAMQVNHIMESDLLRSAMRVNLRYAHLYAVAEETEENAVREWEKLSAFLRYSNISTADYHEIRRRMIRRMGGQPDGKGLTEEQLELLAELEHMRWCRYHWLNNWRYGIPADGKAKDPARRIHADLIPYDRLTEAEKEKDRSTIRVLLDL